MLIQVESKKAKIEAQEDFTILMQKAWRQSEVRRIVWRPDAVELPITHDGEMWFASTRTGGVGSTLRYWNSFGNYSASGNLNISVEINIPIDVNDGRVSGFIARDPVTGMRYLMHDGGIGGGRKGIGRDAFLAWSALSPVPVENSEGKIRLGIIVACLDGGDVDATVAGFVRRVINFKAFAASRESSSPEINARTQALKDYFKEFSGKKSGVRAREFEYISRHGDVVDALAWWATRNIEGRVVKTTHIDLGVEAEGKLVALFEVKTNRDRQCIYTAIGQLEVHASKETQRRFLVLPEGEPLPGDIRQYLQDSSVAVLHYILQGRNVIISDD